MNKVIDKGFRSCRFVSTIVLFQQALFQQSCRFCFNKNTLQYAAKPIIASKAFKQMFAAR